MISAKERNYTELPGHLSAPPHPQTPPGTATATSTSPSVPPEPPNRSAHAQTAPADPHPSPAALGKRLPPPPPRIGRSARPSTPSTNQRPSSERWGKPNESAGDGEEAQPGAANGASGAKEALLRPRPRGPEGAKPLLASAACSSTLDDPLVQWRLRRCRGEEPALHTPLRGRALLDSAAPRDALREPPRRSSDSPGTLQGAGPWQSHDPPEAPWPIGRHFCNHQGASSPQAVSPEPLWHHPRWRPHDSHKTLWPMRSSSLDTLKAALYSQAIETLLERPPGHPQPMFTHFLDYNSRKTAGPRRTLIEPGLPFPSCRAARERPSEPGLCPKYRPSCFPSASLNRKCPPKPLLSNCLPAP
ncbi:translation initiation factor IF-2-like [Serinus canaria]|uniref:translation initiation factor IF-2-like n=1 Tax=Serinus canaria TaxID=9135 RepID=UPI0021CC5D65|nr:translation initiation factor IF-2-like [Serinus canaria]